MNVGSLFSGIGGLDLGLERAGLRIVWQCESDPWRRSRLERHWSSVPCYDDVRTMRGERVDLVCGGFPCRPISSAARGRNTEESLWPHMLRVVAELKPRFVIIEQPEGIRYRDRGFARILGDLASCGYDAEWQTLFASQFGAPHHRARLWVVAYTDRDSEPGRAVDAEARFLPQPDEAIRTWPDPPSRVCLADGIPDGLARAAYGDAVVPQVAEWIGRRIMQAHERREE